MSLDKDREITYQLPSWAKQPGAGKKQFHYDQLKIEFDGKKER